MVKYIQIYNYYLTQKYMSKTLPLLVIAFVLDFCLSIEMQAVTKHNTVVQSNHFFSDYQTHTTYAITQIDLSRPLVFTLKRKGSANPAQNKINIKLKSGSQESQCTFQSYHGLCVLKKLLSKDTELKISCNHSPCEVSWTLIQPPMKQLKATSSSSVEQLYDLSQSQNHNVIIFTCDNPELKNYGERVGVFSEDSFIKKEFDNKVYLLFPHEKKGHLYINMGKAAKSCSTMSVFNVPHEIEQKSIVKDFAAKNITNRYKFASKPTTQFQIKGDYHELENPFTATPLTISLMGELNSQKQTISQVVIKPEGNHPAFKFSALFAKPEQSYSNLQLEMKSNNQIIMMNFELITGQHLEVIPTQSSFFSLKKDQVMNLQLNQDSKSTVEKVAFYPSDKEKIGLSKESCSVKDGCTFSLTAKEAISGSLYVGENMEEKQTTEINYLSFDSSITQKIYEGDTIYLTKKAQSNKAFQVVVNTPNVIVYAASKEECQNPTEKCYEKIANIHNPFVYQPKKQTNFQFLVKGLDNCEFTLTVIDEGSGYIPLTDGQPFSYLMDDHEDSLIFSFKLPQTKGVAFNLISPFGDLMLIVHNGKKQPNEDDDMVSSDGFLSFSKKEVEDNEFTIMVRKTEEGVKKYVHFTLIATTSGGNMRLEPSVAHYQTIKSKQDRNYVFQFDKDKDYILNIYLHNMDRETVQLPLLVSNSNDWKSENVKHFTIDRPTDVLNLKDVSEDLCSKEGSTACEIFIKIVNSMHVQLDITLTLMLKDSVIELKDGIWQKFGINSVAQTTHFYFLPKVKDKSVSIMYKTDILDLHVTYNLWKSDQKGINPAEWPFPSPEKQTDQDIQEKSILNPIKHISVDSSVLEGCWPSCIILISTFKKSSPAPAAQSPALFSLLRTDTFSIMAANKMIEIPQKTKLQIFLNKDEEKYLLVDLKYAMQKQALTFFTSTILGFYTLYGNVYSERNPRCPEQLESDFSFGVIETQIKVSSIEKKLEQNDMEDDNNLYMCIMARSYIDAKFSIQYTTQEEIIKLLRVNTFEHIEIGAKQTKMYQMQTQDDYQLKFTRKKGYFYADFVVCKKDEDYEECLEDFRQSKDKGKQIISKTEQFSEKPCSQCILFVKLSADDPAQVILHVQSKYSVIELKEKDVVSDFTNENEQNKYTITAIKAEEVIINVNVLEGDPVVTVTDYTGLNLQKQKNPSTNMVHIVIPAQDIKKNLPIGLGKSYLQSFALSHTFRSLQVKVKSKNAKIATSYTITYSSGERQIYLEDGLVTGYNLEKNKKSSFIYNNPRKVPHGYITITTPKSAVLYRLKIEMYSFADPNDEDSKVQFTPVKPPMRKKTPNPTITYSIPAQKRISVELQADEQTKVTIIVNHQELILLPFAQQFPFLLHPQQQINMLTDVNNPGFLLITVRKCDESAPELGYTFNYNSFQKSQFQYSTTLENQPKFEFLVKANKVGTLYMNIHSANENSLMAISVKYSDSKIAGEKYKAGGGGELTYEIVDGKTARVTFNEVTCLKAKCDGSPVYYWMKSTSMQEVYTQSVCPYSYFSMLEIKSDHTIEMMKISSRADLQNKISFDYPIEDHISYLSVKAVVGEGEEVYYQPTEVITLWGSLSRSSSSHVFNIFLVILCCLCPALIVIRKLMRPKIEERYEKLESDLDL